MAKKVHSGNQKKSLLKLIEKYHADLADFKKQNVLFEMGTRHAFHRLMADAGKPFGWTLIAEQEKKVNGKTIRPDGTFKDDMNLVRGYWEAKDTGDKLELEIEKKRKAGYPLNNIIFEDTQTAILYQNNQRILTTDMKDAAKLAELITEFFRHIEPEIEEFEHAVDEFKERVPDLAAGLSKKISEAHRTSKIFKKAFDDFFELCKTSLNPNISQAAVDEMLIQHILTERLIREIFDNPEFVRRNVIAAEVEKVMLAMTSHSFDRNTYLKELDRFYVAIEHAARTMTDWSDKQYFLNTVYERFFQGYSVKLADTMGIVYTPQEIVDFMCASVAEVLEKEFGKKLWSDDVYIIDPCTGTGNFIVNLIRRIPKAKLEEVYKHRLFANEIMLLPYYIAALNIEHAYFEQVGRYEGFEGLCFVDTLDLADHPQGELGFMTEKNSERVERQRRSPITVVLGNPPYNVGQMIHNERNTNRAYAVIDRRVKDTYSRDSRAKSRSKLADPYVKFFRWASDRLEGRDGIVCFVSNNSYIDQIAFDGMRKHLHHDFNLIYVLNLQGNVRRDSMRDGIPLGELHTVFGLAAMVGVSVCVLVKSRKLKNRAIKYHSVNFRSTRAEKFAFLTKSKGIEGVRWETLTPNSEDTWLVPETADEYSGFLPIASRTARSSTENEQKVIFKDFTLGVATHRDAIVYDFSREGLSDRVAEFVENYNVQVDRWKRAPNGTEIDSYVSYESVVWDADLKMNLKRMRYAEFAATKIMPAHTRPFCHKWLYLDRILNSRVYGMLGAFPLTAKATNTTIIAAGYERKLFSSLISDRVSDLNFFADPAQCFPFFIYDEDGTNRRENITDWALQRFRDHYNDKKIDKWAIFYYVYGLLHHSGYRTKYADNLKRELPRIPFAPAFWAFSKAGEKLAKLHLDYEKLKPWDLEFVETPDEPLSYRVEAKMKLSKDKTRVMVNSSLTLAGIPPEVFEYRLGNRSALEWVIDQYQVSEDKRSGITSDPNREDDPEYVVRLVGQVVRVSVETVAIVKGLPEAFEPPSKDA